MVRKIKYDTYNDAFKATAVVLGALPGVQAKDVAEVLDIHRNTFSFLAAFPGFLSSSYTA